MRVGYLGSGVEGESWYLGSRVEGESWLLW